MSVVPLSSKFSITLVILYVNVVVMRAAKKANIDISSCIVEIVVPKEIKEDIMFRNSEKVKGKNTSPIKKVTSIQSNI